MKKIVQDIRSIIKGNCEYTYEENEILLYIDTYFSLIKKCTYDLGKYLL